MKGLGKGSLTPEGGGRWWGKETEMKEGVVRKIKKKGKRKGKENLHLEGAFIKGS